MKTSEAVIKTLTEEKPYMASRYGVKRLGLFGSYARNEQLPSSDIDILVETDPDNKIGLLRFIEMENYLADVLKEKIDLVPGDSIKERVKTNVLAEVIYI
jgi:uncharacterized protein